MKKFMLISALLVIAAELFAIGDYDPDKFAYEADRGKLREEYFGIKLADLHEDKNGHLTMTDEQRATFIRNILGKHMCSLQWISWKNFGNGS